MHSSFTYNPNAHRATNYQQHQQPMYNISGFMNHQSHFMTHPAFTRSFASVVSCENNLGNCQQANNVNKVNSNNNSSLLNTFMKHLKPPQYQTRVPQNKEFEDFTHMPTLPAHNYNNMPHPPPPHFHQKPHMNIPIIGGQFYQPSAQVPTVIPTRNLMATLFGGYQQRWQKPRNKGWLRCSRGGHRSKGNKFHDADVNLQKNIHEKERASIERDILDDSCDFVHVDVKDVMNRIESDKKQTSSDETDKDPPFMIYSLEEFPAIVTPVVAPKTPPPAKDNCDEGFVVLPTEAAISTPSCAPRRLTLCEKVGQIVKSSPTRINGYLKPCLKQTRRRYSECSDDFVIEFVPGPSNCNDANDSYLDTSDDDDDSETESEDDDDDMGKIAEEESEDDSSEDEGEDENAEQQLDSGVEEKRVRFNMTPKVHVMRVWNTAFRLYRRSGSYWERCTRDNARFKSFIGRTMEPILSPVLKADHRARIYSERFQEAE